MRCDLPIYACGGFSHTVRDELPNLKSQLTESPWRPPRRSDRLTQLGLLGLAACAGTDRLAEDTPLILASGESNLSSTIQVNEQITLRQLIPSPIAFINSVNNSTAFYLNQTLGNQGRTLTVTRDQCSLEAALQIAATWQHNHPTPLLVGTVDELPADLHQHRKRMQYPDDRLLGEGSFWFRCGAGGEGDMALAVVRYIGSHADEEEMRVRMQSEETSHHLILETLNTPLANPDKLPGKPLDLPSPGLYSTQNGYCLVKGIELLDSGDRLCLINGKRRSRKFSLMIIEKC